MKPALKPKYHRIVRWYKVKSKTAFHVCVRWQEKWVKDPTSREHFASTGWRWRTHELTHSELQKLYLHNPPHLLPANPHEESAKWLERPQKCASCGSPWIKRPGAAAVPWFQIAVGALQAIAATKTPEKATVIAIDALDTLDSIKPSYANR